VELHSLVGRFGFTVNEAFKAIILFTVLIPQLVGSCCVLFSFHGMYIRTLTDDVLKHRSVVD
jgi:hypothetical protein